MKNLVFNLRTAKAQAEGCAKVTKSSRMAKVLTTLTLLLTLCVGQMWAAKGFFTDGQWNVQYWDGSSDKWIGEGGSGATKNLGIKTTLYLKKSWVKTWSDGGWTQSEVVWNYGLTDSYGNTKTATKSSVQGNQTWDFSVDYDLISHAPNNPGQNTLYMYWRLDNYVSTSASYINFTIPGFTTTSTSQTFDNTTVSSNSSKTISFGQHYGTALTTSNCALSGTNSTEFEVTSISETGVTVKFKPSSDGSKSATLTITDAHSKTCTITLSGKTRRAVTYKHGDYTTGSDITDYKVYGTNLTLRSSGFTRTGYNLTAWNTGSNGTSGTSYDLGATYSTNSTLTLYPTWTAKTSTITLNNQGATTAGTTEVTATYDAAMPAITPPEKDGYTFGGYWGAPGGGGPQYYNADGSSAATWLNENASYTLYAKWTPIWQLYNNTTHIGDFEYISDYEYTLTITLSNSNAEQMHFKKDGTTFYYTGADNPTTTNNTLFSGDGMISYATMGLSNREYTLFIRSDNSGSSWYLRATSGTTYSVTYNGNSSTSGSAPVDGSSPYEAGANVTVLGNTGNLSKTGYTFSGWNTQADGNGTNYAVGSTITSIDANKILYAKWTENMTTVTVNVNPLGAGTITVDASAFTPGHTTTAGVATSHTVVATANSGKVFLDWSTSGNATGTNTTNTFTLNGNGNGGNGTLTANFGVASGWYMEGGDFGGWSRGNIGYQFASPYRDQANTYYFPTTLTASHYWKVNDGTTPYNPSNSDQLIAKNTVYTLSEEWSKSSFTNTTMSDVWVVLNTSTKKLWVQDAKTYYTITLANGSSGNTNNGAAGTEGTVTLTTNDLGNLQTKQFASSERVNIAVSAISGYYIDDITIGGNSVATDVNAASYNGYTTMPAGNTTLIVTYKRIYTVTYGVGTSYTSMGSVSTSPDITSGNYVIAGTNITFTATPNLGYKFIGWYDNAACTGEAVSTNASYNIASLGANTTLYAKFELLTLYMNSDINNWGSAIALTHTTENPAVYTYTGTLNAKPTTDATTYATGWHFEYCYNEARTEKAYQYTTVQVPTYSGSSIDGVHTYSGANTIQFGLTRKSDITITLTLQAAPAKPTVNIAADPYYTITYGAPTHGSYTIKVGSSGAVGANTESTAGKTITLTPSPATGYHFDHWTVTKAGSGTVTVTSNRFAMPSDDVTIAATFLPTSYDVTLKANGGEGADKVVTAIYDAAMPPTLKGGGALTAHTRTGYNFTGYYDNESAGTQYYDNSVASVRPWDKASTANLFAHWTPKTTTVTFSQSGTGYGSGGQTSTVSATYDAAMPDITIPTAAAGYCFMGYYDALEPLGTQYYTSTGASAQNWNKEDADATLYAYFKKAEITAITLDNTMFDPVAAGGTGFVIANPTVEPTPVLPVKICWELLYDNGNSVPAGHEAIDDHDGSHPNRVKFSIAGLAAGGYKIKATLRTGDDCSGGTLLSEREVSFTIASGYTVTIQYKDSEGNTIAPSTTSPGKATDWASISAPTIVGYNFSTWVPGDGITLESSATTNSNRFKATFNGTLTARYTKKRVIYFNNTLGWSNVYVYFYSSNKYWADNYGTGAYAGKYFDGYKPYSDQRHGHMTQIEGTNIWYFDYTAAGYDTYENIAFANMDKSNSGTDNTSNNDLGFFSNTPSDPIQVVRRGDHNASLPMFVPLAGQPKTKLNNNKAEYSNQGYWMNYPENTGYALRLFNSSGVEIDSIPFEFTPDKTMPMSVEYILDGSKTYQFKLYRTDGKWFGNNGTMKAGASGDIGETSWEFKEKDGKTTRNNCQINTNAAGTYTFTLDFGYKGEYNYLIGVHYPAAVNDFQILYNDNAEWSLGSAHDANWVHPSRIIRARENGVDTISFFVAKDNAPILKARKVSSINASGAITWGSLNINGAATQSLSVDSSAVYNFKVTQGAEGVINSIEYIGPYTGNYYIRSSALSNKWGNYVDNLDHRMTYSSFSESNANSFGEKYSHYKAKWCPRNTNIAFCIANDYSPCITDTLKQDVGNPYNNTDTEGTLKNDGDAGHSGNNAYLDRYSANVRFMWDRKTNKISRAYISAATSGLAQFLVLRAGQELHNENNVAISSSPANSVLLSDNENWIYEARLMIKPGTRFKLYACYAKSPVDPASAQYFRGAYDSDNFTSDDNSVILIGGESVDYQLARIVYDFKTNRLIAAWMPSGEVSGTNEINADIMVIRDHQESARCITFADGSANLSAVKTVYGVMRFNRWILNNRQHPEDQNKDHARPGHIVEDLAEHHPPLPVGQQKSTYERRLYFISFPFDVLVGDIFGFGTYGQYWVIQYYDGLNRAKKGYWMDSKPNWKYVSPTKVAQGYKLEKNQGYILELNLSAMAADNTTFWSNGISTIELYFPSTVNQDILKQTDITIPALSDEYECTINRGTAEGDRRVKDSYWRCIGVPSYNLYNSTLKDGSGNAITWKTDYTWQEDESEFPFIYMWNKTDNTLTPQATSTFTFQPMHAYLTQIKNAIVWTAVSAKPSSIVARRARKEATKEYNWRIELKQDTTFLDQTYVRMTDLEQVTDNFDFGQDLIKEFNSRSNIYTFIGYEKVAANSMTLHTDQTSVIPVGANITTEGDYTFALPDGADGIGVTLIDEETGTRTNLSAGMDYTVYLEKGTHDNRFWLEISPVQQTPTDIEAVSGQPSEVRKVLIDGILYIVKDGKLFDARGARVE